MFHLKLIFIFLPNLATVLCYSSLPSYHHFFIQIQTLSCLSFILIHFISNCSLIQNLSIFCNFHAVLIILYSSLPTPCQHALPYALSYTVPHTLTPRLYPHFSLHFIHCILFTVKTDLAYLATENFLGYLYQQEANCCYYPS